MIFYFSIFSFTPCVPGLYGVFIARIEAFTDNKHDQFQLLLAGLKWSNNPIYEYLQNRNYFKPNDPLDALRNYLLLLDSTHAKHIKH